MFTACQKKYYKFKNIGTVTVDWNTWIKGKGSHLLDQNGNRCCLGFECKQRGISDKILLNKTMPSVVSQEINTAIPNMTEKYCGSIFVNKRLISLCMATNDNPNIGDTERMNQLVKIFCERKLSLFFINVPTELKKL